MSQGSNHAENIQSTASAQAPVATKKDRTSIIALVFAIVGLVLFWMPYVAVVVQLLGIFYGYRGMKTGDKKLGQIALGLGVLGLIVTLLFYLSLIPWSFTMESTVSGS